VPSLKTTVIPDNPVLEIERTSSTSGNAYITASIGKVINCSTSSAANPGASVLIATCTLVTSGKASKFILLKSVGKFLHIISRYIAYIKERFGSLKSFNVDLLKNFDGVLYDITVSKKQSNNMIMEAVNNVPKFSMLHGLNAPWVEPEFNCKQFVKKKSNVTVYTMSHLETHGYNKCFGISNKNIVHVGIPRHDSDWIEFIFNQSHAVEEVFDSFVFIIGRPASPYNTAERKRKALKDIYNTICVKHKLKLVVKAHPKESLYGIDGDIYNSALGAENYGKSWIFSNSHPFILGKKAIFCISFFSGVVIDMLALKKLTIEYLNLDGLNLYDNSNSLRDGDEKPVFPYRYTNLVFGASCKQDFDRHVESILTQHESLSNHIISNYENFYKPFDGSSQVVCDDILRKVFN